MLRCRHSPPSTAPPACALAGSCAPSRVLAAAFCAAVALGAASSGAAGAGILEPFGLDGRTVTSLGVHGGLYAGTLDDGVSRRDLDDPQAIWIPLGLEGKRIRAVYPHSSGPIGFATTVGLENDPLDPDSALVYCLDMDQPPWMVSDSGMTRADISAVWSLDGFPSPAICGETFAGTIGSAGGVWRRSFGGTHWEFVLDIGFGVCNVVRANPASGDVWAGGETAILAPWIARSIDGGDTWQVTYPDLAGDNACNSIAIHPDDSLVAYAGMEGPVLKTSDGGATWKPTGLDATQAYIYGVALDSASPLHVLAGGTVRNPNNWALWESLDGGDTWTELPAPAPGTTGISSIAADPTRAGTFYIGTFGHGVWWYRHLVTGVHDLAARIPPRGLALGRIYPNPFRALTTIEYEVPSSLAGIPVSVTVYSLDGGLVRRLVTGATGAGPHRVAWNAEDTWGRPVPPSAYHVELRVGAHRLTRRLAVVR